jgi:hypothetical protein
MGCEREEVMWRATATALIGKQHADGGHVLFNRGRRGLAL